MKALSIFKYSVMLMLMVGVVCGTHPYAPYVANKDTVIVKQKIVEFDADTYLGLQGYYAVQDDAVAKHGVAAQLTKKDDQIDALIKLLEKKYGEVKPDVNPPELPPTPPVEVKPDSDTNVNAKVFAIFKKNCVSCHGPNQASGKLKLIDRDAKGEFLVNVGLKSVRVYDRVKGEHLKERGLDLMPLNKGPIDDKDVLAIYLWMIETTDKLIGDK